MRKFKGHHGPNGQGALRNEKKKYFPGLWLICILCKIFGKLEPH